MSRHIPRIFKSPVRPDDGRPAGRDKRRGPIERTREDGSLDPRWTLNMEYEHRELMRPSQYRKMPLADQLRYDEVEFPWGQTNVRGYKLKNSPAKSRRSKKKATATA